MNQLISNMLMQPKPDATESLTLIEKLEREKECWHDDGENNVHRVIDDCIDIVKQHQAKSGWVPVSERLPPDNMMVLVYCHIRKTTGYAFVSHQQAWSFYHFTKNSENQALAMANDISNWMPIPKPPSEVQDAT